MSLSRACNDPSYTPETVAASNIERCSRHLKRSKEVACAGPGHHQVNVHHRRKYYTQRGFSVVFVSLGACSVPKSYGKLALLGAWHGVDVLLEDFTPAFVEARSGAGKTFIVAGEVCNTTEDKNVTSFRRVSVCLYEAFRELFQPHDQRLEVLLEFSDGKKCFVAEKDSVLILRDCDVTRITVRLQPVVCRVLCTFDELKRASINGMYRTYTMFVRKVALDGARKEMYSVLFFSNRKGFVCTTCGHHCRSLRDAVAHTGDEGRMNSFQKVILGLNGTITLSDTVPSDFVIYKTYFEKYSQPVNAGALRLALNARPHKKPRNSEIP